MPKGQYDRAAARAKREAAATGTHAPAPSAEPKKAPAAKKTAARALDHFEKWEADFEKRYGEGTLESGDAFSPYEVISTGSLAVDDATGVGGIVEGRLNEIFGPDGLGKTTWTTMIMAEAQKKHPHKRVAVIDMERKFSKPWAAAHGVNLSMLYVYRPNSAEDVADALKDFIRSEFYSLVVLDSIGAMIPEKEKEKAADETVVGTLPKIVTRMVKIAAVEGQLHNTTVIFLNQVRANLSPYGKDTTTGGGWALRHGTTMKFEVKAGGGSEGVLKAKVGDEDRQVGRVLSIYLERNNVAPAHRTAMVTLINVPSDKYGQIGIDKADEAATIGVKRGIIIQRAGWFTLPLTGEQVQGRDTVIQRLRESPEMIDHIRNEFIRMQREEIYPEEQKVDIPDDEEISA